MNSTEQRRHGTVTQQLTVRIETLETVTEALDQGLAKIAQAAAKEIAEVRTALREERSARIQWVQSACDAADKQDRRLGERIEWFERLTFWERLNWVVRGRRRLDWKLRRAVGGQHRHTPARAVAASDPHVTHPGNPSTRDPDSSSSSSSVS